jgi:hypothetical protein
MTDLMDGNHYSTESSLMAEIAAMQRALEDHDFRNGLSRFFESESLRAKIAAADAMAAIPPGVERAMHQACLAKAYDEAMTRLRAFIEENVGKY